MTEPNFLVIGAARSGTTALCESLAQHPDVFMSEPKEPHYFAFAGQKPSFQGPGDDVRLNQRAVTQASGYRAMFEAANGHRAVGEGSVSYLYYPEAAERIRQTLPHAKLICLLRQPADRAYSAYMYMRSCLHEPLDDFRDALAAEEERIAAGWHHMWHLRRMGYYHQQLSHYFERFDPAQIRVYLYDDFQRDPQAMLRDCFQFLEIDETFEPAVRKSSTVSGAPRSRALGRFLGRNNPWKDWLRPMVPMPVRQMVWRRLVRANMRKQALAPELRAELTADFREDILRLQDMIDRDLSAWLVLEDRNSGC